MEIAMSGRRSARIRSRRRLAKALVTTPVGRAVALRTPVWAARVLLRVPNKSGLARLYVRTRGPRFWATGGIAVAALAAGAAGGLLLKARTSSGQ
jgi:hypothetical protein